MKGWSHGYSGIPKSIGVILDWTDYDEIVIAQNGKTNGDDLWCTRPYSQGCSTGVHAFTNGDPKVPANPVKLGSGGQHEVLIHHDAARRRMIVTVDGKHALSTYAYDYFDIDLIIYTIIHKQL